jgi:hypothetical protein
MGSWTPIFTVKFSATVELECFEHFEFELEMFEFEHYIRTYPLLKVFGLHLQHTVL